MRTLTLLGEETVEDSDSEIVWYLVQFAVSQAKQHDAASSQPITVKIAGRLLSNAPSLAASRGFLFYLFVQSMLMQLFRLQRVDHRLLAVSRVAEMVNFRDELSTPQKRVYC